jgi:hypothetical protein
LTRSGERARRAFVCTATDASRALDRLPEPKRSPQKRSEGVGEPIQSPAISFAVRVLNPQSGCVCAFCVSRRLVPAVSRTGHPFAASGPEGRRRRLSLCSLPVPKHRVREPRKSPSSPRPVCAGPGSLRIDHPDAVLKGRCVMPQPLPRSFPQQRNPAAGVRPPACMQPAFWRPPAWRDFCDLAASPGRVKALSLMNIEVPAWPLLRVQFAGVCSSVWKSGFAPLCRQNFFLRCTQPAIADCLLDLLKARWIADLQHPRQGSDRSYARNRLQSPQPVGEQRIGFQRVDQCMVQTV